MLQNKSKSYRAAILIGTVTIFLAISGHHLLEIHNNTKEEYRKESLKIEIQELEKIKNSLGNIQDEQIKLKNLKDLNNKLEKRNSELDAENAYKEIQKNSARNLSKTIEGLTTKNSELEIARDDLLEEENKLKKSIANLSPVASNLEVKNRELVEKESKISDRNREIESLEKNLRELKNTETDLLQKKQELQESHAVEKQLKADIQKLNGDLASLDLNKRNKAEALAATIKDCEKCKTELQNLSEEKQRHLLEQAHQKQLQTDLKNINLKKIDLLSEVTTLESQRDELENRNRALERTKTDLETTTNRLNKTVVELEARCTIAEAYVQKHAEYKGKLEAIEAQIADQMQKLGKTIQTTQQTTSSKPETLSEGAE